MKKLVAFILVLSMSLSSISTSYAGLFDFFKKEETQAENSGSLVSLLEDYSKKVRVNINFPKKVEDKYSFYIEYAKEELVKYLKKQKVDQDLIIFNYENVIWENEVIQKEYENLKGKDSIAEYLVCLVYTYADKDKNIKTAKSYYLCKETQEQCASMMKKILEEKNNYKSDQSGFSNVIERGLSLGSLAAGGGFVAGSFVPVLGNGVGTAVGAVGGFLYGAGSELLDNYNKDKVSVNKAITELPEDVYKAQFTLLPGYEKPNTSMLKESNLDKYLNEKSIKDLNNATKKFTINE